MEELDLSSFLNETNNATNDANALVQSLQTNHILYETYAYFDLFFGETGLLTRYDAQEASEGSSGEDQASAD
jgi:hypothetical protein